MESLEDSQELLAFRTGVAADNSAGSTVAGSTVTTTQDSDCCRAVISAAGYRKQTKSKTLHLVFFITEGSYPKDVVHLQGGSSHFN